MDELGEEGTSPSLDGQDEWRSVIEWSKSLASLFIPLARIQQSDWSTADPPSVTGPRQSPPKGSSRSYSVEEDLFPCAEAEDDFYRLERDGHAAGWDREETRHLWIGNDDLLTGSDPMRSDWEHISEDHLDCGSTLTAGNIIPLVIESPANT